MMIYNGKTYLQGEVCQQGRAKGRYMALLAALQVLISMDQLKIGVKRIY